MPMDYKRIIAGAFGPDDSDEGLHGEHPSGGRSSSDDTDDDEGSEPDHDADDAEMVSADLRDAGFSRSQASAIVDAIRALSSPEPSDEGE